MTVRQLLANIDSREISEWMAFLSLGQNKQKEGEFTNTERIKGFFQKKGKRK